MDLNKLPRWIQLLLFLLFISLVVLAIKSPPWWPKYVETRHWPLLYDEDGHLVDMDSLLQTSGYETIDQEEK